MLTSSHLPLLQHLRAAASTRFSPFACPPASLSLPLWAHPGLAPWSSPCESTSLWGQPHSISGTWQKGLSPHLSQSDFYPDTTVLVVGLAAVESELPQRGPAPTCGGVKTCLPFPPLSRISWPPTIRGASCPGRTPTGLLPSTRDWEGLSGMPLAVRERDGRVTPSDEGLSEAVIVQPKTRKRFHTRAQRRERAGGDRRGWGDMVGAGMQAKGPGWAGCGSLISGEELLGQHASQGHLLICCYCSAFPGEVRQDLINCVGERPESAEISLS